MRRKINRPVTMNKYNGKNVPLSRPACWDESAPLTQYPKQRISLKQQKQLYQQGQGQQKISNLFKNVKNTETLKKDKIQIKLYYITTAQHKRVSPEFLKILNEHETKDIPENYRNPVKLLQEKSPPPPFVSCSWENAQPNLAAYLRRVMEEDNIFNSIYGINFYAVETYVRATRSAKSGSLAGYLNLAHVAFLLKRLLNGQKLTAEEYDYFKNFLKTIVQLMPKVLRAYLLLLKVYGGIWPAVLGLLKHFLVQMISKLNRANISLLVDEIEKFEAHLQNEEKKQRHVEKCMHIMPIEEIKLEASLDIR